MSVVVLYLLLLKASVMSFSGFGSVPIVRDDLVVHRAVVTDQQLSNAIAIGQATPGPIGMYLVTVGYFAAGVPGACAALLALATPALMAVPILRALRKGRTAEIRGGSSGIVVVSCVLLLASVVDLAPGAVPSTSFAAVAAASFAILLATPIPPIVVVAASALVGVLMS